MPQENIVIFPKPAEDRAFDIEECMAEMGNIITLMRLTIDGNQNFCARGYLVREIEKYHIALNTILFPNQ
jgi:hypothetical protein